MKVTRLLVVPEAEPIPPEPRLLHDLTLPDSHLAFTLMPGQWTRRLGSCSSQARSISTAQRTSNSNVRPVTPLSGIELGPTQQNGHRTLRKRLDGKKTLPIPPLLDPVVLETRSRYEQKKEKPKAAEFTPFQHKLWENPFGALLIL